jgi:hypothetical protein
MNWNRMWNHSPERAVLLRPAHTWLILTEINCIFSHSFSTYKSPYELKL